MISTEEFLEHCKALRLDEGTDYLLVVSQNLISMESAAKIPGMLERAHGIKVSLLVIRPPVDDVRLFNLKKPE